MHNTTATIARFAAGNTDQPKGTSDGQYRFRVCMPDDVPTDDCDPALDIVKDNATAFFIVFIAQILAICSASDIYSETLLGPW